MKKCTRFKVNKLIRDKIPDLLENQGNYKIFAHTMDDAAFLVSLKKKLLEESQEVVEAQTREELVEEIADVMEVINNLCKMNEITLKEVESVRLKKIEDKGGFEKRIYQTAFDMNEDHRLYKHFRSRPDKYPEDTGNE